LKLLLAHNYYGSSAPSGENQAYEAERDMLRRFAHSVFEYVRHADDLRRRGMLGTIQGGLSTPWNFFSAAQVRRMVLRVRPDVVHCHNTFPSLSPAVFRAVGSRAARVLTLHNYRLFCPAAIPMRHGEPCTTCLDTRAVTPALRFGCYRSSRIATAPLAASVWLHRALRTWDRHVDAFIVLTAFQRERMVAAGLPAERVFVKPNFYPGDPVATPWCARGDYVVFAGRLTPEKGPESLIRAWMMWGQGAPELRVLGDGPLRERLEQMARSAPGARIAFLGPVSSSVAEGHIAAAKLVIVPSQCYEGFPMVIREAFAFGTPVAASSIGPLPSIVHGGLNGTLFRPGDPASLLHEVQAVWSTPALQRLSEGARTSYRRAYTERANHDSLMEIYARATWRAQRGRA
jgi:glycosyltransferase involved in cell wall biosynthesis